MNRINAGQIPESGLVVLDVTAHDEATACAVMAEPEARWATSGITPVRREAGGVPGVRARVHADSGHPTPGDNPSGSVLRCGGRRRQSFRAARQRGPSTRSRRQRSSSEASWRPAPHVAALLPAAADGSGPGRWRRPRGAARSTRRRRCPRLPAGPCGRCPAWRGR
ncbi:DUF6207 family protein [Streptomyces sp. NPDC051217]|uniref:DUF6207 family protein n=1 Tax=Streptomyces sp. NPDC051217 TaxID=3365644 RepID=UPI0037BE061F